MKKYSLLLSALLAFAAVSVQAADEPAAPAPAKKQVRQQIYGYQMMTPAERTEYFSKMRAAQTPEERVQLCEEHHAKMQARAKERGMSLPDAPRCGSARAGGRGGRMGPGGGAGPGGGMGPGRGMGSGGGMMQGTPPAQ